jgi:hypothetical protein
VRISSTGVIGSLLEWLVGVHGPVAVARLKRSGLGEVAVGSAHILSIAYLEEDFIK